MERTPIGGATVRLEPLDPELHAADLYAASHGDERALRVWTYLPYGPFPDLTAFTSWLRDRAASADPLFFAVRDCIADRAGGMVSFLATEPEHRTIEMGHIWFGPALQNTRQSTEALYLMMAHTFERLRYRRLEWKCNALNEDSRRAALRLGFEFEGIFYQHRIVKGRNRDTAWYSLLDGEWPPISASFQTWLSPENFDEGSRPRQSLRDLTAAVRNRASGHEGEDR
ncbi:MAG: GNAT family N-acetyltransferase [Chloroflexi bacterium]|nr:GNAT family N-acetyltransferase [Chloroflexota bacterium]